MLWRTYHSITTMENARSQPDLYRSMPSFNRIQNSDYHKKDAKYCALNEMLVSILYLNKREAVSSCANLSYCYESTNLQTLDIHSLNASICHCDWITFTIPISKTVVLIASYWISHRIMFHAEFLNFNGIFNKSLRESVLIQCARWKTCGCFKKTCWVWISEP